MRAGYVLTGGRSSRFGGNKAFADVDGKPMAVHVADRVRAVCDSVTLVGPAETYGSLGLRVIEDSVADFGPVAGVLAALEDSSAQWSLIVACDMPSVRTDFLDLLVQRAESSSVDVVMPLDGEGREQPLCAVYSKRVEVPLRRAVATGISKVRQALEGSSIAYLPRSEYAEMDPTGDMLLNVNRPEDLGRRR